MVVDCQLFIILLREHVLSFIHLLCRHLKFLYIIILYVTALAGHAFEARIYAENVQKGFLPATGVLHHYHVPVSSEGQICKIKLQIYL